MKPDYLSKPSIKMICLWLSLYLYAILVHFLFIAPFSNLLVNKTLWVLFGGIAGLFATLVVKDPGFLKSR